MGWFLDPFTGPTHLFMRHQVDEAETALEPVLDWVDEPDRGCTSIKICTWDRPGLFWRVAGSLSAIGVHILSARVFTGADGIALFSYDSLAALDSSGSAFTTIGRAAFDVGPQGGRPR